MAYNNIVTLPVGAEDAGARLDVWLLPHFDGQSRANVQRWIKEGHVTRDGVAECNPARKVRPDETYAVNVPEIKAMEVVGEDLALDVVYEDNDLIVINKPAGMTVHPAPGNYTGTLVHGLVFHAKNALSGINGEMRPGIVHRIDKDTSGLLVVAKNDVAHRRLANQFAKHSIHRVYIAAVRGRLTCMAGDIRGSIGRHPAARLKRAVVREGGKSAVTHYRVLKRFGDAATLVECKLETGRTHQIRVHMAHLGHPLLGDPLYGNPRPLKGIGALELPKRQMLHAAELGFKHPTTGDYMQWEAPLPDDMHDVIEKLNDFTA